MSKNAYRVALAGATGLVGGAFLERLSESSAGPVELFLLASDNSAGQRLEYNGHYIVVENLADFDFTQVDLAVFFTPTDVTAAQAMRLQAAGCKVLDFSGAFLTDLDVPVTCPGVTRLTDAKMLAFPGLISLMLAPLLAGGAAVGLLESVDITAMLPASFAGQAGADELASQTAALLNAQDPATNVFPDRLAFQLQRAGDSRQGNSHQAIAPGTQLAIKRLFDLSLPVACQAFWLPVFYGVTLSVSLRFKKAVDDGRLQQWMEEANIDVAAADIQAAETTLPSESGATVRGGVQKRSATDNKQAHVWLAADNVQLSAALGVQTVEILIKDHLY